MKINLEDYPCEYSDRIVSNPTAAEGGRSFTLQNDSKLSIKKWSIDKVVFRNRTEKRCDYLLKVDSERNIYYWIELKGSNVTESYKQILSTIHNIDVQNIVIHQARIIATKNRKPDVRNKEYIKLEEIVRLSKGKIIVRINHFTERI